MPFIFAECNLFYVYRIEVIILNGCHTLGSIIHHGYWGSAFVLVENRSYVNDDFGFPCS